MHILLFDIDGTLISTGGAGRAALENAFAQECGYTGPIQHVSMSGRTDRAIIRDMLRMHGYPDQPESIQRVFARYLTILPTTLAAYQGRVLPGIAELLDSVKPREDVAVGLLTGNIQKGARLKLAHYRLDHHFAFGGFGDRHFDRDDVAREALEAVTARCNGSVCPDRIWVIGDTPFDVRCARSIGARALAVCTGWHCMQELAESRPDLLLQDLSDPGQLLAALA